MRGSSEQIARSLLVGIHQNNIFLIFIYIYSQLTAYYLRLVILLINCIQQICFFPTRRLHATCSELPRNHIISKLHVVFNGCAEVPSKLCEVFLLGLFNTSMYFCDIKKSKSMKISKVNRILLGWSSCWVKNVF